MINAILLDIARLIVFSKSDAIVGSLNSFYQEHSKDTNFDFFNYYRVNDELLNYLERLKNKYEIFGFTKGIIHSVPEIKNKIDNIFDEIYTVNEIGFEKDLPNSYLNVCSFIQIEPEEVIFIDDIEKNLEAAKVAGLNIYKYTTNEDLFNKLGTL
ncbi:MAG: HAD-IA family hydrolase [bacterium]